MPNGHIILSGLISCVSATPLMYATALKDIAPTTKRTIIVEKYNEYLKHFFSRCRILQRELFNRTRRVMRYQTKKAIQKTLNKLADRLTKGDPTKHHVVCYGDGSFKAKRGHVAVPRKKKVELTSNLVFMPCDPLIVMNLLRSP